MQVCMEVKNSHLWRSHQPRSISGLESAQAVESISSLLTEAAFGGWRSPLLLVQRQTLHTAVHLHNNNITTLLQKLEVDPSLQRFSRQTANRHLNLNLCALVCGYLAESRRAGGKLSNLHVFFVVGVVLFF